MSALWTSKSFEAEYSVLAHLHTRAVAFLTTEVAQEHVQRCDEYSPSNVAHEKYTFLASMDETPPSSRFEYYMENRIWHINACKYDTMPHAPASFHPNFMLFHFRNCIRLGLNHRSVCSPWCGKTVNFTCIKYCVPLGLTTQRTRASHLTEELSQICTIVFLAPHRMGNEATAQVRMNASNTSGRTLQNLNILQ